MAAMRDARRGSERDHDVATAPVIATEVKTSTCYMCACRCGIRVYLQNGTIRYIEGNPEHPVNRGVLCAKGSAGIMQQYAPARLRKPLLRTGARGEGKFKEIDWEEALTIAANWLGEIRHRDPKTLAFFTGRDQSQSFTGWWAQQFGTLNFAAHGGFCSVNMAAAGLYTIGGAYWEFGEPDWEHTRYFLMFGMAEDHDSNPIKIGLGQLKQRPDTKFVSVNPVRTGYSAIADEWVGIRPGTDGLLVAAIIRELLRAEKIDWDYISRYTNAGWLIERAPGSATHGLVVRDAVGTPLCWDAKRDRALASSASGAIPQLVGEYQLTDGRRAVPAFQLFAERFLEPRYAPEQVAAETGVSAARIKRLAAEIAKAAFASDTAIEQTWTDTSGKQHSHFVGRPVAIHAMRGISAHTNGFHTCRLLHVLQMLLGTIDVPGGFRYKPPFPKAIPPRAAPARDPAAPGATLAGMPLGFPAGPQDLVLDDDGQPQRLDKAFSWEHPLALHGMMHMVIHNAWAGVPYPIDTLFMYMANMAWNSTMNVANTLHCLTDTDASGNYRIPHFIYVDAYYSETVAYADLVVPDTTYLERWDCISLLDRPISNADGPADAIRQPVVTPERDVRPFQDVLLELGARLGLPGMVEDDGTARYPGGYSDYLVNHLRGGGIGPLAGWRGHDGTAMHRGAVNPAQLQRYIDNGCFWKDELAPAQRYYKFANQAYLDYAHAAGWIDSAAPIVMQLYCEPLQRLRLAAEGHGAVLPPVNERQRVARYCDPVPMWYAVSELAPQDDEFPLHAITQRPMHMYHSWGGQNAWLRQITARNFLYVHYDTADALGVADGDWVWVISAHGRVKAPVKCMHGVNRDTVWTWNAIGKRRGAWGLAPDTPEATQGFLLNHLITELLPPRPDGQRYSNSDPVTGQAAWFDLKVRIEKCSPSEAAETVPQLPAVYAYHDPEIARDVSRFGAKLKGTGSANSASTHRESVPHTPRYDQDSSET